LPLDRRIGAGDDLSDEPEADDGAALAGQRAQQPGPAGQQRLRRPLLQDLLLVLGPVLVNDLKRSQQPKL
jgi:hypothetical protein